MLRRFLAKIGHESDRGLALIGSAFIDEKLADVLSAFFAVDHNDLIHGRSAPLSTFSARIRLCHALGLIEDVEQHECNYVRRIRNEFAHKVATASFRQQQIVDLCRNLKSPLPEPIDRSVLSRSIFENALVTLASRLLYRDLYVKKQKLTQREWVDPETLRWRRIAEEPPPAGVTVLATRRPEDKNSDAK